MRNSSLHNNRYGICLEPQSSEKGDAAITALFQLFDILFQLRQELLGLIPSQIKHKNQMLDTSTFSERILPISMELGDKIKALEEKAKNIK